MLLDVFEKGKQQARKLEMDIEKVDPDTEARVKRILSRLELEGWAVIMDASAEILAEVTKDGMVKALLQIGLSEEKITETMSRLAVDYAKQRGAELVGKRLLPDGMIIDNPNSEWFIEQSTRDLLRGDVTRAVEEGWSTNRLRDELEKNYAFSEDRADMIARTETAFADSRGNMITYKESGVVVGKEWILGSEHDLDDICDANAAQGVIALNEPFQDGSMEAPAHPNCLVGNTVISAAGVSKYFKRWFEGEIIILSVPGMNDLSVTPNHPILTDKGWIKAGLLKKGDNLIYCDAVDLMPALLNPHDQYVKIRIKDMSGALSMAGSVTTSSVPSSAEAFHGDGSIDGKIDIIRADSLLWNNEKIFSEKRLIEIALSNGHFGGRGLDADCPPTKFIETGLSSPDSPMSSLGPGRSDCRISDSHFETERIGLPANRKSHSKEPVSECGAMTPDAESYIASRLASHVFLVELENVRIAEYAGHVFNLQTRDNFYIAQNLIVSNCICDVLPIMAEEAEA